MPNEDTLLNIVLDQSSSMSSVTDATIEGMNELLAEQRKLEGNLYVSLTLFDTQFDVRYVATDVQEIPNFGRTGSNVYSPRGMTALYDALATTIRGVEKWQQNNQWFDGKVLTIIWTDGGENSSKEFARHNGGLARLNELIQGKTVQGWDFTFLGAGSEAWLTAQDFAPSIPVAHTHTINNATMDYAGTSKALSVSLRGYRGGASWDASDSVQSSAGTPNATANVSSSAPVEPGENAEEKLSKPRSGSSTS